MNGGRNDQDDELVRLLGKLRDRGPAYPARLYTPRRAAVLAALAALQLGGAVAGVSLFAKIAKIVKGMGMVEKIVLGVEVAAVTGMTAYGAATAYVYRDQLKQLLLPPTAITSPFPSLSVPSSLLGTEAALTESPTPSPTGSLTVTPTFFLITQPSGGDSTPPPPPAQATQPPPQPTNPGLHLGQTKTPKAPGGPP